MGYAFATGTCLVCRQFFTFNPVRVPSFRNNGVREPVCLYCMGVINRARIKAGVPAFQIPLDAYEPCDERELPED